MKPRGQALVEYALITLTLAAGFVVAKSALGPLWPTFLNSLGLYNVYASGFDAVVSLPLP